MISYFSIKYIIRALIVIWALVFSVAYGVNGIKPSSLQSIFFLLLDDEQAASIAATTGTRTVLTAALSKGRFTLNNPWTQAELDYENISATISYQSITGINAWVRPYATLIVEYEARRRQCEQDYNLLYPSGSFESFIKTYTFTDRKCYPTNQWVNGLNESTFGDPLANQVLYRYGYYCGGGFPDGFDIFDPKAPEPLDSVDYCCRLHDAQTWANQGTGSNECGMVMCLRQASARGLGALPTDVEVARQFWYGNGPVGGAATACPGNQSDDAPAPVAE